MEQISNGDSGSRRGIQTWGPGALEEDLLGGDHGEPGAGVLLDGVAELGPLAALDGAAGEAGLDELTLSRAKPNQALSTLTSVLKPI